MKIGREPEKDLDRVRAAREAIGDAELFVDANGAYSRKKALAQAELCVKFAKQTDRPSLLAQAWHAFAVATASKGQNAASAYDTALDHLTKELLAAGTDSDAMMNNRQNRRLFSDAVEYFIKAGKTARAMEVLEMSRDAQTKQAMDPTAVVAKDPKVRERLARYEAARARIQALEKQLRQVSDKPSAQRSAEQLKTLGEQIATVCRAPTRSVRTRLTKPYSLVWSGLPERREEPRLLPFSL